MTAMDQMTAVDQQPPPDEKDWTWVLEHPCAECGFDAASVAAEGVGARLAGVARRWRTVLEQPHPDRRPDPAVWSPLQYGCHVRDVLTIFGHRFACILAEDGVRFENWDQDAAALTGRYREQSPDAVVAAIATAADAVAVTLARAGPSDWQHSGLRSNGSVFTLASLAQYFLHDLVHHLHDVRG